MKSTGRQELGSNTPSVHRHQALHVTTALRARAWEGGRGGKQAGLRDSSEAGLTGQAGK